MKLRCDSFVAHRPLRWHAQGQGGARWRPEAAGGPTRPRPHRFALAGHSGLVLNFTQPCPPLSKTDCSAIWVAWGECEADGTQTMRFTVGGRGRAARHVSTRMAMPIEAVLISSETHIGVI